MHAYDSKQGLSMGKSGSSHSSALPTRVAGEVRSKSLSRALAELLHNLGTGHPRISRTYSNCNVLKTPAVAQLMTICFQLRNHLDPAGLSSHTPPGAPLAVIG